MGGVGDLTLRPLEFYYEGFFTVYPSLNSSISFYACPRGGGTMNGFNAPPIRILF